MYDEEQWLCLHSLVPPGLVNLSELLNALQRAINKELEKKSRLAPYFEAHFEFQSPYQSPSPSPEPNSPRTRFTNPDRVASPNWRKKKKNSSLLGENQAVGLTRRRQPHYSKQDSLISDENPGKPSGSISSQRNFLADKHNVDLAGYKKGG
ncbi:hypothetical protein N7478_001437 [Penicillium angulare]|uniref:uncharacterized protein n=1 Tax=Penicillium angulare TaxID=116970 RepID=UPI002541E882|nr:uncharacterized protein N7478_001437 [Penicillium angulare]KAJ5292186.1 hypothetical protein N7478_001437 [Penicillium angulare]